MIMRYAHHQLHLITVCLFLYNKKLNWQELLEGFYFYLRGIFGLKELWIYKTCRNLHLLATWQKYQLIMFLFKTFSFYLLSFYLCLLYTRLLPTLLLTYVMLCNGLLFIVLLSLRFSLICSLLIWGPRGPHVELQPLISSGPFTPHWGGQALGNPNCDYNGVSWVQQH